MSEIWKDVPGYNGQYQVSNYGRVRNMNWRSPGRIRLLSPHEDKDGYLLVCLSKDDGTQRSLRVHRLVAEAFLSTFRPYLQVNHIDENKKNNNLSNLECLTPCNNCNYGTRNLRMSLHKVNGNSKKVKQLDMSGNCLRVWDSGHEISRVLGYDNGLIFKVCQGKKKTAYGFRWEYAGGKSYV